MDKSFRAIAPILFLVGLVVALASGCRDEIESLDPAEIYVKYFGTTREDEVIDMIQTPDGGFLLLGYTRDTELGSRDYLVIKTTADGNRDWQMQYNGAIDDSDSDDVPSTIRLGTSGDYALIMGTANFNTELESMFMLKISIDDGVASDTLLAQYKDERILDPLDVDYEFNGLKKTRGADVLEFGDSYIILGSVETGLLRTAEANRYNIYLANVSLDGSWLRDSLNSVNWDEFDGFNTGNDIGVRLLEDRGEYFYLASSEDPDQGNVSKVMVKHFDEISGNEESDARRYGAPGLNDVPINFTADQFNLFVTGASGENLEERAFFLRVNKSLQGNEDFKRIESLKLLGRDGTEEDATYTGEDEGSRGQDIVGLDNGDFFIIGQVNNYTNSGNELKQNEVGLIRVDGQGNVIPGALQVYGSDDNDWGKAILRDTTSNGLIIGATVHFGGEATMMSILKTNRNGELGKL